MSSSGVGPPLGFSILRTLAIGTEKKDAGRCRRPAGSGVRGVKRSWYVVADSVPAARTPCGPRRYASTSVKTGTSPASGGAPAASSADTSVHASGASRRPVDVHTGRAGAPAGAPPLPEEALWERESGERREGEE